MIGRRAARAFRRLAHRGGAAILVAGASAVLVQLALALLQGLPQPRIHDEFSYLLAADTYAHGRLTNPTHPLWRSFETMHVLHRPTYISKYPPGQGLLLAAGQLLSGRPIAGVWLGAGLACAAACWMLQSWTRPAPALLGALLLAAHPYAVDWGSSYWGGQLPLLGGSLVLGAAARLARGRGRPAAAASAMGTGMALLAITRPFEGAALSLVVIAGLAAGALRRRTAIGPAVLLRLLPRAAAPVAAALAFLLLNNLAVTGRPTRLPYAEYEARYSAIPLFLSQLPTRGPVAFGNRPMEQFERRQSEDVEAWAAGRGPLFAYFKSYAKILAFYVVPGWNPFAGRPRPGVLLRSVPWLLLALPLLLAPRILLERRTRPATAILAAFTAFLALSTWQQPHYAAPAFGLVGLLLARSARQVALLRPGGRRAVRLLIPACLLSPLAAPAAKLAVPPPTPDFARARAATVEQLRAAGGRHLVLVRYADDHDPHEEWVYNAADIDAAPVVWARELDPGQDRALLHHFRDRQAWLLRPDEPGRPLAPYEPPEPGPDAAPADARPPQRSAPPR